MDPVWLQNSYLDVAGQELDGVALFLLAEWDLVVVVLGVAPARLPVQGELGSALEELGSALVALFLAEWDLGLVPYPGGGQIAAAAACWMVGWLVEK